MAGTACAGWRHVADTVATLQAASIGLGRIVALCYRSSIPYQIHAHKYSLPLYLKRQCDRTLGKQRLAEPPAAGLHRATGHRVHRLRPRRLGSAAAGRTGRSRATQPRVAGRPPRGRGRAPGAAGHGAPAPPQPPPAYSVERACSHAPMQCAISRSVLCNSRG
jgi:hypothetical protein